MNINIIILLLFSVLFGIIIGTIIKPNCKLHGPNAMNFCSRTYFDKNTGKYYKFGIKLLNCPNKKFRIF